MRQPLQVTVFPLRVAGGVEEGEDHLVTAARRETTEEAGLAGSDPLYKLDMVSGVAWTGCYPVGDVGGSVVADAVTASTRRPA